MKIKVLKVFQRIGNEEVPYYLFFEQGCIEEPLFLMLPSNAEYLYNELRTYFDVIENKSPVDLKGGGRHG